MVSPSIATTLSASSSRSSSSMTMGGGGESVSAGAIPSGQSSQNLLLDSSIRDWVVLPLLVIMISAGLLRHYVGQLLRANGKRINYIEGRSRSALQRSSRLRGGGGGFLSSIKWESRRRYMSAKEGGYLRDEADWCEEEKENPTIVTATTDGTGNSGGGGGAMDMMNPMNMMEGMKGNMAFMVQNMVMMQGISHFFKGFVLVKVPFPLTNGFKMMFQRGLDLTTLETSYVSSVSWYFLVMFGLRAFFRLVIGDPTQETIESNNVQRALGTNTTGPAGPQQFDAPKALRNEADNLELARHISTIDDVEKRILGKRYPKKKIASASSRSANPGDDIFGLAAVPKSKKKKA